EQMLTIRSKTFDILFGLWTALFGAFIPLLMLIRSPRLVRAVSRAWVRGALFLLKHVVGLDYVERGRENLPATPCIVLSNH
ncbi:hypothetical protein, partial [Proteus mirabilis]|uniref:hypothetical protein n=1 Tax=Proteus mirabilis TaxID=584 RepID=UPI001954A1A3